MSRFHVIDSDGHVLESSVHNWEAWLEPEFHDRAPHQVPFETGGGRLFMEGKLWNEPFEGRRRTFRGRDTVDVHRERRGMVDPAQRLTDMQIDGIDVSVLFGGAVHMGVSGLKDIAFGAAMARAYNNWAAQFCAAAPDKLKFIAAIPVQDGNLAAQEARRAVEKLGAVGLGLPPNHYGSMPDHRHFDPIYAEAVRLDVPVCFHMIVNTAGISGAGFDRYNQFLWRTMVSFPFEMMMDCAAMICYGVFERFPNLRAGYFEGGSGWIPFWFDRMHEYYEFLGHEMNIPVEPIEYLRRGNVYFSCAPEETTLTHTVAQIGADRIMFASDYWHFDCEFPGTVAKIADRPELSDDVKAQILSGTAAQFFRLPAPVPSGI